MRKAQAIDLAGRLWGDDAFVSRRCRAPIKCRVGTSTSGGLLTIYGEGSTWEKAFSQAISQPINKQLYFLELFNDV